MSGKLEILKAFEHEPNKTFSTTLLVENLHPQAMRSIREHLQYGTKQQRRDSQLLKSKLHRQTLYHLNRLVDEKILDIDRIDAHGEKIFRLAKSNFILDSKQGAITIQQHILKTHFLEQELEAKSAHIFEEQNTLSRVNSFYIDSTRVDGLGQLTKLLEQTLKIVNDVVCLGDFQHLIGRYTLDDLQDFLRTASILTLDEARTICLIVDARHASLCAFTQLYTSMLPKRVNLLFVVDQKTVLSNDFLDCIESLRARHERINIHYAPTHSFPLFIGKAGAYGIDQDDWQFFKKELTSQGFITSQATVVLDMKRLAKEPAHIIRKTVMNAAKALHSIASQQRLANTAVPTLRGISIDTHIFFSLSSNYLRFWNYDWESSIAVIQSCTEELQRFAHTQETIYRACGLPFHFSLTLSSAFDNGVRNLSARSYRKWTVNSFADFQTESFQQYCTQRLQYMQQFCNVDRFRIFRGGNPTATDVAREIIQLGQRGFPLLAIDFRQFQGTKPLTEFFS